MSGVEGAGAAGTAADGSAALADAAGARSAAADAGVGGAGAAAGAVVADAAGAREAQEAREAAARGGAADAGAGTGVAAPRGRARFARGVACALAGAALWGLSGTCAQFLLSGHGVQPTFVTAVRMLGAGVLFLAVLAARDRRRLAAMLCDARTAGRLAVFGVALFLCQITYVVAVGLTNAGTATVLQSTGIAFTMLATCALARTLPRLREVAGLVAALASVWLVATQGDPSALSMPPDGLAWGIANGMTVAFYVMYPKRLFAQWGSLPVTGLGMLAGGVLACAVLLASGALGMPTVPAGLDASAVAVLAVVVLAGTFAAFALYLHGVSVVGSVKGSLLGAVEPVSATALSALWLGTAFSGWDWAGLVLMLAMVFLVTAEKPPRPAVPAPRV